MYNKECMYKSYYQLPFSYFSIETGLYSITFFAHKIVKTASQQAAVTITVDFAF